MAAKQIRQWYIAAKESEGQTPTLRQEDIEFLDELKHTNVGTYEITYMELLMFAEACKRDMLDGIVSLYCYGFPQGQRAEKRGGAKKRKSPPPPPHKGLVKKDWLVDRLRIAC